MTTVWPIRQILGENHLFTPKNVQILSNLDAIHRIIRNARIEQKEVKIIKQAPKGTRINGIMSTKQEKRFFSFLYLETSSNGKPFISKEVFDMIFENGLIIPDVPLKKKYLINCSLSSPRNIVDYAIHLFMKKNQGAKKAPYLKFFGSYFVQYSDALVSPRKLEILASNISGYKSPRCNINFNKYLPVILRDNRTPY